MFIARYNKLRYGTIRRLRDIFLEAPWSNYDLLVSLVVIGIGIYLIANNEMFENIGGVYYQMASVATERQWGALFVGCGSFGLLAVIWCNAPGFVLRLSARMATAFCILVLAGNNALNMPPPLSTVTYMLLSVWSVWGILRTHGSGR